MNSNLKIFTLKYGLGLDVFPPPRTADNYVDVGARIISYIDMYFGVEGE